MTPMPDLSILVPTLGRRAALFDRLKAELDGQIARSGAEGRVEILSLRDDGELTTGEKRNLLLERARGRFVVSVDDDDDIHPDYVGLVLAAIDADPEADCLGIRGEMRFPCGRRRIFVYSIAHRDYGTRKGVLQRPPHHLNPIRRSIALAFPYEHTRAHEDADVALRMARSRALRRERMIEPVLYHYNSRRSFRYQQMIEMSEPWRHPLMLRWVNLLRLKRALREGRSRLSGNIAYPSRER